MQVQKQKPHRGDHGRSNRSLFRRTIFLMVTLGVVLFIPLIVQLYKLQITEHSYWDERAANQQRNDVAVSASRGTIYDREGRTMAMSATVYKLILSPRGVYGSVKEEDYKTESEYRQALRDKREMIVDWLADTFDYDEEWLWARMENTGNAYVEVATELEEEDAEKVREFVQKNRLSEQLYLTPNSKRYYPYSSVASHVLGYMSKNENSGDNKVGAMGIEALYEDALSGERGRVVTSKNGHGMEMISGYEMYFDAQDGCNLTLTLDERIQAMLEQTMEEGIATYDVKNGAFGIVMEPKTGAILAMASTPDFDPNHYAAIVNEELAAELEAIAAEKGEDSDEYTAARREARDKQWRNRALADAYEPGSVFKPITVAMALEEGYVTLNDRFYCGGSKVVVPGTQPVHCHKHTGHGDQTLTEAVENSCNVALMDIGLRMGPEIMWKYFNDFGLRSSTGIDLVGEGTQVFWPEEQFKGPTGTMSVAISSFGQTMKVTPIQMITAFAAVINGGHLLEPYLVQSITDSDGGTVYYHETSEVRQVISETTSDTVRSILESVVANGSGHNASMAGYCIGGKTGTSEKRDEEGDDVICSFMGFAPADDPQVLVLLAYDSPRRSSPGSNYTASGTYISGGNITAPMAGSLIASILDYMGVEKQYSEGELAGAEDTLMPRVIGSELTVAKGTLQNTGFNVRTVGTGSIVTGQLPSPGVSIPGGSTVVLYLDETVPEEQVETPNLMGVSPTKCKETLEGMGLFLRATGVADYNDPSVVAAGQSIDGGTMVSPGTVVEVRFVSSINYGDQ
ncbi:MAG: PASTA domain-containing protein [Oscillospiraceae bacterium]|jgi:stage V sporulation protein D (sporulation-specific penicillin-binding protein)|nr:PASTA domain-containing protein [Oscillospiraceae bacterium]